MTNGTRYCVQCWSSINSSLAISEAQKHAAFLEGIRKAPFPWTPTGDFRPLRKAGAQAASTLEVLSKKLFPRWINEVQVDYMPRTPGALGKGVQSKDVAWFIIEPNSVPNGQWVDGLVRVLASCFTPGVIAVYNEDSFLRRSRDYRSLAQSGAAPKCAFDGLFREYGLRVIPEMIYISDGACFECFNVQAVQLFTRLRMGWPQVSIQADCGGHIASVTDRYLNVDASMAAQEIMSDAFAAVLVG